MGRFPFSSLRARIFSLVLVTLAPAIGLMLYLTFEQRRLAMNEAERELHRLTRLAASYEDQLIQGVRQFLVAMAHVPEIGEGDEAACRRLFAESLEKFPAYRYFGVINPDGKVLCRSWPSEITDFRHHSFFRKTLETRDFSIGEYELDPTRRTALIYFGYPVLDVQGVLRSVVFAAFDFSWINTIISDARLPQRSAIRVIDESGMVMARFPHPEKWVGKSIKLSSIPWIGTKGEGFVETEGVDGVKRFYAFIRLAGMDRHVFLNIGIPKDLIFNESRHTLTRSLKVLGAAGLLSFFLAWFIGDWLVVRRVKRLVEAARQLSYGDPNVRSGLKHKEDELGQLATAFDEMVQSLKRREEELTRSNRELEQFAYVASHDLQEPLRKIIAFGDRLKEIPDNRFGDTERDYLARIHSASSRMKRLIEDLLHFSRAASQSLPCESASLEKTVREVLQDLDMRISQAHAKVQVGPLPAVCGNPMQLRQLFSNLIGNALKFSKKSDPPLIEITAKALDNGFHEITVRDNGIGFDEKYLDRIFKPFQRLHSRQEYEGTGIGLAICQKIVQRYGGNLTAKSRPGEGAAFIFTLPS